MSQMSKFVAALMGMLLMTMVASRQLFLFTVLRDSSGLRSASGPRHFWFAVIAGTTACAAGGLMLRFFNHHEKNKWSKVAMTPTGPPFSLLALNPTNSPALECLRVASANLWVPEGQADDRMPMDGSVSDSGQTPPGQRSFARRTHQLMFKKWSQARHD